MNVPVKAARNGSTPSQIPAESPSEGLDKLRREEATSLISLINEAIYQTSNVAHTMHSRIYSSKGLPVVGELDPLMAETLNCWQTASHYLRLLSDVMADIGYDIESPL